MRTAFQFVSLLALCCLPFAAFAQSKPQNKPWSDYLGKWDITGEPPHGNYVYWLEIKEVDGKLAASFLNRGGSVLPVSEIKIENGELLFTPAQPNARAPKPPTHHAKLDEDKVRLLGLVNQGGQQIAWLGVRPPQWSDYNTSAKRIKYGTPVQLFVGKDMASWVPQNKEKALGWSVVDGAMTNEPKANNLVSLHRFEDFKIQCEYKVEPGSNSGIYLRGRYELQVLDDFGKPAESHGHMALYSRVAPKVNASKPVGEWQLMEAILIGNRLSVWLNGQKVHDNIVIDGITGGALDSREAEPGPIMIQGDHEKITYRKIVVTPIIK
jgi:hypothetical protein